MEHSIIYKKDGVYAAFPQLDHMPDDRLAASFSISYKRDHTVIGEWAVYESSDGGRTWSASTDPTIPHNWPAPATREYSDRFNAVLADGTYICAGTTGWQAWDLSREEEARSLGMKTHAHRWDPDKIAVNPMKLVAQYSKDKGQSWTRNEWDVPGFNHICSFSRGTLLEDGTVLLPVYGTDTDGKTRSMLWRSSTNGHTGWRLIPMGNQSSGMKVGEQAVVETNPGTVLSLARNAAGYFVQMWSDDSGKSWSDPLLTDIWAPHSPPDLTRLADGRILCTYGYRRQPMGIRAVLSNDGGETWETDNTITLREDGGIPTQTMAITEIPDMESLRISGAGFRERLSSTLVRGLYPSENARPDLGYAISTQLSDGTIVTVYYITLSDAVTHCVATRWEV